MRQKILQEIDEIIQIQIETLNEYRKLPKRLLFRKNIISEQKKQIKFMLEYRKRYESL